MKENNSETDDVSTKSATWEHTASMFSVYDSDLIKSYLAMFYGKETVRKKNRTLVQIYACRRGAVLPLKCETIHVYIKDRTPSTNLEYWLLDCMYYSRK
jgi:hypothetical protein